MAVIEIGVARADELRVIRRVQRKAFGRVAREYGIDPEQLPPVRESLDDLERLHRDGVVFLVAREASGSVIGSVRATEREGTVEIGRLVVDDDWLRRGVATLLMQAIERHFSGAETFELFTGADASAPLALYEKMGYRQTRRELSGTVELVWLEKAAT